MLRKELQWSLTAYSRKPWLIFLRLPRYIAVEGPIRVGKSTLARILAERLNAQQVMESEENPFLGAFTKANPERVSRRNSLS